MTQGNILWFSPDGLNIWCASLNDVKAEVWGASLQNPEGWETELGRVETLSTEDLPDGCSWVSSCGYRVTDDWWILGPDGKRLLMLPPPWRSEPRGRVWKGHFLVLMLHEAHELVILELL